MNKFSRLRELDFLRGVAIILVLISHSSIHIYLKNSGWIGVDLFFILSGFLVSSLLFREYKTHGKINFKRFLIRRGFKIYPLFYLTAIPYTILKILQGEFATIPLLGDLLFLQNYVSNWAYLYGAGWSLAVEEHFYFGISAVLFFSYKSSWFEVSTKKENDLFDTIVKAIIIIMASVFFIRLMTNIYIPNNIKNCTLTHLRIDSLMAGVLLSYLYNFKFKKLKELYLKNHRLLLAITIVCLIWVPFINPMPSFFVRTIGFNLVFSAFFLLLLSFLMNGRINQKLDSVFSAAVVSFVSKIGVSSYAIYIVHMLVNWVTLYLHRILEYNDQPYLIFFLTSTISILSGFVLTHYVENYFLNLRDKYYPRIAEPVDSAIS